MLIHTHQRTAVQNALAAAVRVQLTDIRQRWRYDRETIEPELRGRWNQDFRPTTGSIDASRQVPFEAIVDNIDRLLRDPIAVLVLNSTSDDVLDYDADPTQKVVLI